MNEQHQLPITGIAPLAQASRRAGRVLWIERIWPALLPGVGILLVLVVLSLLTLPQRLPVWLHAVLLAVVVLGIARLLHRRLRAVVAPSQHEREHRIERASRLLHHPLSTLRDRPASPGGGDAVADLIWQAHLERTRASLRTLSVGSPRLGLRAHDRFRLGPILLAALGIALVMAGRQAPIRIASGFWPGLDVPLGPRPVLQGWITPPDYAGGAPIFLTDPHGHYAAPSGARLTVSLTGLADRPSLVMTGGARFSRLSERSWTLEQVLSSSTHVTVRGAGYGLADWTLAVEPAAAPVVSWTTPPGPALKEPWHTSLPWSVAHRYGVQTLVAELRLAQPANGTVPRVLRVPIPLPGAPRAASGVALPDLAADPWAGEAVVARLVATDVTGGTGRSAEARFSLPARPFRNPLARAVLDVRRRLALGREQPAEAADDLQALGDTPGAFAQDSSLFLNLSTDASLLRLPNGQAQHVDEASARMWELALALEDGLHNDRAGARAALDVRAAQDRLSAQLEHMRQLGAKGQSDAAQAELQARIAALTTAIARRMQELAAQAARNHTTMPAMPDQSMLSGQDLERMLQKMRDAAASGHADQAMRQLSQMQSMLDQMRAATPQDLESARQQAEARQQAKQQMDAVQDLVKRQSSLLDRAQARQAQADQARTRSDGATPGDGEDAGAEAGQAAGAMDPATRALMRQLGVPMNDAPQAGAAPDGSPSDAGRPSGQNGTSPTPMPDQQPQQQADRHAQHVLQRALDELGTEFKSLTGKQADSFADAARAMDRARDALGGGRDRPAVDAQMQALAALQKGAEQMRSAMSGGGGSGSGGSGLALLPGEGGTGQDGGAEPGQDDADGQNQDDARDPLGRHMASGHAGMDDGSDTHVPDHAEPARSREIEQELRRRDSDRTRPQQELDYLDRLLKPF